MVQPRGIYEPARIVVACWANDRQTRAAGSGGARSFCQGLAKGKQDLVAPTCLLSPFPLAGPRVVVGKTALDHIAAPLIARHDKRSETAAAEAKRAEGRHKAEL